MHMATPQGIRECVKQQVQQPNKSGLSLIDFNVASTNVLIIYVSMYVLSNCCKEMSLYTVHTKAEAFVLFFHLI